MLSDFETLRTGRGMFSWTPANYVDDRERFRDAMMEVLRKCGLNEK